MHVSQAVACSWREQASKHKDRRYFQISAIRQLKLGPAEARSLRRKLVKIQYAAAPAGVIQEDCVRQAKPCTIPAGSTPSKIKIKYNTVSDERNCAWWQQSMRVQNINKIHPPCRLSLWERVIAAAWCLNERWMWDKNTTTSTVTSTHKMLMYSYQK